MLLNAPPTSPVVWLLAVAPIVLLVAMVLRSKLSTGATGAITTAVAIAIGWGVFGANASVTWVAVAKGMWTGLWILYVIWAALLLYHVAAAAGLDRMGDVFASILPRSVENALIVAWIFPSFIQGVAGFGTPIAVAAPLLLAMGYGPVRAVALPLIGYHWSVTFGSMGSSFYMAALTAGLVGDEFAAYSLDSSIILAVNMVLAGVLVCLMHGGTASLRRGLRLLMVAAPVMAVTLILAVRVEPAVGSLAAASAGLAIVAALRRATRAENPDEHTEAARSSAAGRGLRTATDQGTAPAPVARGSVPEGTVGAGEDPPVTEERPSPMIVFLPYALLLLMVLAVFLPPASREFVKSHLLVGPSFPETATATGFVNSSVDVYTPIALLGHPGSYILLAALFGLLTYRFVGVWPTGVLPGALSRWFTQARRSTLSVVALTTLATVMVDAGMVRVIATGAATVTGGIFPAVSPVIGALGSFTTGSTTTSNALFSALQRDVAVLIGVRPSELLAAQTAGGNVGNALAPVVILIGATAVDIRDRVGEIFRAVLGPAAVLTVSVVLLTLILIALR